MIGIADGNAYLVDQPPGQLSQLRIHQVRLHLGGDLVYGEHDLIYNGQQSGPYPPLRPGFTGLLVLGSRRFQLFFQLRGHPGRVLKSTSWDGHISLLSR